MNTANCWRNDFLAITSTPQRKASRPARDLPALVVRVKTVKQVLKTWKMFYLRLYLLSSTQSVWQNNLSTPGFEPVATCTWAESARLACANSATVYLGWRSPCDYLYIIAQSAKILSEYLRISSAWVETCKTLKRWPKCFISDFTCFPVLNLPYKTFVDGGVRTCDLPGFEPVTFQKSTSTPPHSASRARGLQQREAFTMANSAQLCTRQRCCEERISSNVCSFWEI